MLFFVGCGVVVVLALVVPFVVAPVAPAAPFVRGALLVLTCVGEVVFIACGACLFFGLLCSGLACLAVGIVIGIGALLVLTLGGRARSCDARVVAGPPIALALVPPVSDGTPAPFVFVPFPAALVPPRRPEPPSLPTIRPGVPDHPPRAPRTQAP